MFRRLMMFSAVLVLAAGPAMAGEIYSGAGLTPETIGTKITQPEAGVLRVEAAWPTVVNLADLDVKDRKLEDTTLQFSVTLQAEKLEGFAFLEMWVHFSGENAGAYFSRGLDKKLTGDTKWGEVTIPFLLQKGQIPDRVTLNLQVNGKGAVLIKDVKLSD